MKWTDPIMQELANKYPAPIFSDQSDALYEKLIESIISQQLSIKAADTIYMKFKALFTVITDKKNQSTKLVIPAKAGIQKQQLDPGSASGMTSFPTPQQILAMPDETLRIAGISFRKISYIKSVADAFLSGLIDEQKIKHMTDEEVIAALTQIRGVGKWTAEMILIFTLKRPDVFSLGDLGLRNAITNLYGITDWEKMLELSRTWSPNRSTACWYLWKSLENK